MGLRRKVSLAAPALRDLAPGSAEWFERQRAIILSRPLVKACYDTWYRLALADADSVPSDGAVIELGAGGGFLKSIRPDVVTSDVVAGVADRAIDARSLPFADASVRALILTQALHHVPDVNRFFCEADRVLVPRGVISIVDVAATPFARLFFSRFHHEPFLPRLQAWSFDPTAMESNQALSWMVFVRDRSLFQDRFPRLAVERMTRLQWLSYLLSGGVTRRNLVPRPCEPIVKAGDWMLKPLSPLLALHWHITIRKR